MLWPWRGALGKPSTFRLGYGVLAGKEVIDAEFAYPRISSASERAIRGTTTVGVKFKDFVVLAADKRATAGYYVAHKRVRKIVKITDYMALTTAGLVADAQALAEWLRAQALYYEMSMGRRMPVRTAASLLSLLLFSSRSYIVQLLVSGYDTEPRLYSLDWFGTLTEERYVATGSGSPTAIGILESEYREDMKVEEAIELVKKAVFSSIRRDAFTGNGIDVVVIGKNYMIEKTIYIQ